MKKAIQIIGVILIISVLVWCWIDTHPPSIQMGKSYCDTTCIKDVNKPKFKISSNPADVLQPESDTIDFTGSDMYYMNNVGIRYKIDFAKLLPALRKLYDAPKPDTTTENFTQATLDNGHIGP